MGIELEKVIAMVDATHDYEDPLAPKKPDQSPAPLQVGYADDIAKGAAGGLGRGTAGLLGLPGDIAEYGARGIDYATRKIGGILGVDVKERQAQDPTYGSAAARRQIESVTGPLYEPKTLPGQYASTIGEFAPAALIPGGGGLAARAFNTVAPAVASETAGQLTKGTPYEPYARGIAGVAGGVGAAKAVTPAAPASAARQAAVAELEAAGVPLTAGQRTGSKPLQYLESTAADMPFSAGRARAMNEAQAAAYDRAVTERVYDRNAPAFRNVPADVNLPDPRVVAAGKQSLQDEYKRLTANNSLKMDPQLGAELHAAEQNYNRNVLPSQRTNDIKQIKEDIAHGLVQSGGIMPGDVYQATRSRLGRLGNASADPYTAGALKDMQTALDGAMRRSLSPADQRAWELVNTRYGRMKQLENAVAKDAENLSPLAVAQSARSGRGAQYATQANDLDTFARAGAQVLKPLPQSGTAPRTFMQNVFNLPNVLAAGGGAAGSAFGPVGTAIGAAAPFALARGALSRPGQAYLGNQALPQRTRDVIAQTLAQQAISQENVAERNRAEREDYERRRRDPLQLQ